MPFFTPEAHSLGRSQKPESRRPMEALCTEVSREAISRDKQDPETMRAILVDDYPPFLAALVALLRDQSVIDVVGRAHSGTDGLKLVSELTPDLVLVDYSMPDMDGITITRLLKAGPNPPKVVIVTSHAEPEYKELALHAGADGFVVKSEVHQDLLPLLLSLAD